MKEKEKSKSIPYLSHVSAVPFHFLSFSDIIFAFSRYFSFLSNLIQIKSSICSFFFKIYISYFYKCRELKSRGQLLKASWDSFDAFNFISNVELLILCKRNVFFHFQKTILFPLFACEPKCRSS